MIARLRTIEVERRTYVDAAVALALALELELELWLDPGAAARHRGITVVVAVLYAAPIAVRRRWPAAALLVCTGGLVAQRLAGARLEATTGVLLPLVVLAYSAGVALSLRRAVYALAVAMGFLGAFMTATHAEPASAAGIATGAFFATLVLVVPWSLGRVAGGRSRRAEGFAWLASRTAAERDEQRHAAVMEERDRIRSELEDIIAHSVSAMVVQAGGAKQLLRTDPARARESILALEHAGRETLTDLRRLVGMLRKEGHDTGPVAQPGLCDLEALLHANDAAGLACELQGDCDYAGLTRGVDLVAYRVIEATLALARSHAAHMAIVSVRHDTAALRIRIHVVGDLPEPTFELQPLRTRVELYNGTLRTLPRDPSGFTLRARLPLETAPA
jgi:signal transduction histidine kinase